MISVDKALEIILNNVTSSEKSESVDIFNCFNRVLFNDIIAPFNVPPVNNSRMDGYALISSDTIGVNYDNPAIMQIIDEVRAGYTYQGEILKSGCAIRIMTGAPIPNGADSVVPFEDTAESENSVKVFREVLKNENIRFTGEDILQGGAVLKRGTRLDSAESGIISSLNLNKVNVYQKPKVAIISTGDEISEPGNDYTGNIINSNAYILFAEVKKYGGDPVYEGIVKDNYNDVKNVLNRLSDYDIIISTGGVSMGRYDFIPAALKEIGIEIKVQKVHMTPGKAFIFGTNKKNLFFGLPGNPVSVMVSFIQFVRPALLKMNGFSNFYKPVLKAQITENISKQYDKKYFIRGVFSVENGVLSVSTTGPQGSGILTSMGNANCLIVLPEEVDHVTKGELVDIQLIFHREI